MPKILWKEPAPLWNETRGSKPHVVELKTDDFIPAFLQGVQEQENYLYDNRAKGKKLYQPLHQRYYLVTGSLVCRMAGFPDKTVEPQNGEKTYFVIRRRINNSEFLWIEEPVTARKSKGAEPEVVKERGWHPVTPANEKNEERFPVHSLSFATQNKPREIYYGYIPVGNRKKYIQPPTQDTIDIIENYNESLKPLEIGKSEFKSRIVGPWVSLLEAPDETPFEEEYQTRAQASFYILVDFCDFLKTWLEPVWKAIVNQDKGSLEKIQPFTDLYTAFEGMKKNENNQSSILKIFREINEKYDFRKIADGEADPPTSHPYTITEFTNAGYLQGEFSKDMREALKHSNHQPKSPVDPHRLLEAIEADQGPDQEQNLELRMVYEYDPDCPPIFSDPIRDLTFAAPLDNDAPARPVTIEMPDIDLKNMRKMKHGVQIKMPKKLRDVVSRLKKETGSGGGLSDKKEIGVDAVCIFSIPIITLCAFIVMMIFMIALNFIFWWLPFLKICLPLPKKGGSS